MLGTTDTLPARPNPTIVAHGSGATVFGAIGLAVPTSVRLGEARAAARVVTAALDPVTGMAPARPTPATRLVFDFASTAR